MLMPWDHPYYSGVLRAERQAPYVPDCNVNECPCNKEKKVLNINRISFFEGVPQYEKNKYYLVGELFVTFFSYC